MSKEKLKKTMAEAPELKGEALKDYAELSIAICENQIKINPGGSKNWVALKNVWQEQLKTAKKQIKDEN